ncbi:MAG: ComEC/Rec2 family competence protein [Paludibacteraceae bacterium]|nr:ComEC/Rec2 family competence protein [Paludibacteraceae bacterium]
MNKWLQHNPFALLLVVWLAVIAVCHVRQIPMRSVSLQHTSLVASSQRLQQRLVSRYAELGIKGAELGTLSALTLGYRVHLDKQVKHAFMAAGAMHVLAVSGLHTGILLSVLLSLLTLFGRYRPLYEERGKQVALTLVLILLLVGYAFLTGCSPSVVRSVWMASLGLVAVALRRRTAIFNIIFASAFFILLVHPNDLFSISFQLSYAAVLAIVLFMEGWERLAPHTGLIGVSIAAQVGTLPIALHYFGQMSNYFLLTNLLVIPLAWLMMVGGVALFTVGWWQPLGVLIAKGLNGLTYALNHSVAWIETLRGACTHIQLPPYGTWVTLAVAWGILIAWYLTTKQRLVWK